tara:strand:+ start:57 stop:473 length:417 start_codon:yes stop_codon:yes gene_type:complete
MKHTLLIITALFITSIIFTGCATTVSTQKLRDIRLDMNKNEIIAELGEPLAVRGSMKNKFNQTIEVWEYKLDQGKDAFQKGEELMLTFTTCGLAAPLLLSEGTTRHYWMYFYDDRLVQWGERGDWKKEADVIYEVRFR